MSPREKLRPRGIGIDTIVTAVLAVVGIALLVYLGTRDAPTAAIGQATGPTSSPTPSPTGQAPAGSSGSGGKPGKALTVDPDLLAQVGKGLSAPSPASDPAGPTRTARFRVGSFNVLGANHTVDGARGYRPGPERAADAGRIIAARGLDVVGLQELQGSQVGPLLQAARGYRIYPGLNGPRYGSQNSIAWRTKDWTLVAANTNRIAYFNGRTMPMPVVKLRHRATGVTVVFLNFHNPATTANHGDNGRWRALATRQQIALLHEAISRGENVVVTGDMNAHERYFCAVTAALPMHASNQTESQAGRCTPPDPIYIDWIMGGPTVAFAKHIRDLGADVQRTSDHPLIYADTTVRSVVGR